MVDMNRKTDLLGSASCEKARIRPSRFASECAEVGTAVSSGEGRIGRTLSFDSLDTAQMDSTATVAQVEDLGGVDGLGVHEPKAGGRGSVPKLEALGTKKTSTHDREVSTCREFSKSADNESDRPNSEFDTEGLSTSRPGPVTGRQAGPGVGISMARSKSAITEPDMLAGSISNENKTIIDSAREDGEQRKGDAASQDELVVQTAGEFLVAELKPSPVYPTTDVVWGQTERDRVYNALISVPYHLERLVALGNTVCLTSFLSIFTVLPLRVMSALWTGIAILLGKVGILSRKSGQSSRRLRGDQIFDLISIVIFSVLVLFLWNIKAGAIYFWVKELTQEFLKLSVLHTALELSDKICCSFGVDVLEALAASCTLVSSNPCTRNYINVISDATVALLLLLAHSGVLMAQALVYGVAMNSQKNTLVALLIASNFTEIKGTVLKRFDPTKLFVLACQDIVERFHLFIILSFVLAEEATGLGQPLPSTRLIRQCVYVVMAEVVIDVTKHAVLGKFNDIRPGVYAEFTRDLCENIKSSQSHTMHKLIGLEPFAGAALFLRVAVSFLGLQKEIFITPSANTSTARRFVSSFVLFFAAIACWIALALLTFLLGYIVKSVSAEFLSKYDAKRNKARGRVSFALHTKHLAKKDK